MNLYDELQSHFLMPTAYADWSDYRAYMTDLLIQHTKQYSLPLAFHANMSVTDIQPTLLIVGAGACNDLDLSKLLPHFSSITLLDYNNDTLQQAKATYHLEDDPHVITYLASINGQSDTTYRQFCYELSEFVRTCDSNDIPITDVVFDDFCCHTLPKYLHTSDKEIPVLSNHHYDYVWCVGVHSQLQSMFAYIFRAFEENLKHRNPNYVTKNEESRFYQMLKEENNLFIPRFHDALLKCATQNLFIGVEESRVSADTKPIAQPIHTPIEGAYQAIQDLQKRPLSKTIQNVFWPFHPDSQLYYSIHLEIIQQSPNH
ncbi:MAG: hypothetical protein Q4D51_02505 [Eubacteriales bacterium]|nr:hypothetical protein [Eubacteriales bacterium]